MEKDPRNHRRIYSGFLPHLLARGTTPADVRQALSVSRSEIRSGARADSIAPKTLRFIIGVSTKAYTKDERIALRE